MKKSAIAVLLTCSTISGLALADNNIVTIFNKSADFIMSVDYQLCTPDINGVTCGPVATVDVNSAKVSPGKNFVPIAVPNNNTEVVVIQAVEKNGNQPVAKTIFYKYPSGFNNSSEITNCKMYSNSVGILDDMNGSSSIVCTQATL